MPASARQALAHQPTDILTITAQNSLALSQTLQKQLTALDGQIAAGPSPETSQEAQQVTGLVAQITAVNLQRVGAAIFRSTGDVTRYIDQQPTVIQVPAIAAVVRYGDPTGSLTRLHTVVGRVVYTINVPTNMTTAGAQAARLLYNEIVAIAKR